MYERYFGFEERPFRLVPDPAYLFLSRSHQEALAHLVYTVQAGEGFVSLTGEVGTGKTTLCRAFLEQIDPETEVAYIFNPPADPVDLMRAVNRDFGLPAQSADLQDLIHHLNSFLIEKKRQGKEILLIIDEAQNLNRHVLEQIRLLSNLETSRNKLLQIILVGQPELHKTLQSDRLRQLRQRVTLRCRLAPLSLAETEAYIRHRLKVASKNGRPRFTRGAIRRIFRFSEGIPRLINMACDRGLLTAFTKDRKTVNAGVARDAIKELRASSGRMFKRGLLGASALAAAVAIAIGTVLFFDPVFLKQPNSKPPATVLRPGPAEPPAPSAIPETAHLRPSESVSASTVGTPSQGGRTSLERLLEGKDPVQTRSQCILEVLRYWGETDSELRLADYLDDDLTFFQISASQAGMEVFPVKNRLDLIEKLGLPAILELVSETSGRRAYGVLTRIVDGRYHLNLPEEKGPVITGKAQLLRFWPGAAYLPWKNFYAISGRIPGSAPSESLLTLKLLLRDLGYENIELTARYDEATRRAVVDVQARQGLSVDGVVGPMTKIALYNMKEGLGIPRLMQKTE